MKEIVFTNIFPVEECFYPEPAIKNIPEWYKKTNSFIDSKTFKAMGGKGNQTVKKCMPVFDAMTAGYIIKTYVDVYVELDEKNFSVFSYPSYSPISFHDVKQAEDYPITHKESYPKWANPWSIQTPKGYSSLFIPPMHNPNNFFTILPGIVDTDQYINPVNFPFVLNDNNFEGLIPAGTPMCQVIPFKRDSFKMQISNKKEKINAFNSIYNTRWLNNYKSRFWNKKEYR